MLEVLSLRKQYGSQVAVKGLSFTLNPGDIFGFIGSNGAGKTTTIKMLATLLEPTAGTATLFGADVRENPLEVRRMIGYMPDFFGLYDDVRVWEYLDFFAAIYEVPTRQRPLVINDVLSMTQLTEKRDAFVQSLSRGMQQRLCLARCLVHDPKLLLLDEPASGLDPRARSDLKDLLVELAAMGKMVVVSSHILPELADFCNTVGIIERGEMLAFGPVGQIVESHQPVRTLEIRLLSRGAEAADLLTRLPSVANPEVRADGIIRVEYSGDLEGQAAIVRALVEQGHGVVGFQELSADLEDVFLKLTTGSVN